MARNIEVKARVPDLDAVRSAVASLCSGPGIFIDQTDTFFVVSRGRLKIREFGDGSGELIAYDRPDAAGPRESVYTKVSCDQAAALASALATVLPLRGRVRKRRQVFLAGRTRIHLDDVEHLGCFVELEVVLWDDEPVETGRREAEALMNALSISPSMLVTGAYIDLLEQSAG